MARASTSKKRAAASKKGGGREPSAAPNPHSARKAAAAKKRVSNNTARAAVQRTNSPHPHNCDDPQDPQQSSEDSSVQANTSNAAEGSGQAGQDSCPMEEVLRLREEVASLNRRLAEGAAANGHPQEIERKEKPRGEAGRDYNLEKAMGLADDHELYLSIAASVRNAARAVRAEECESFRHISPKKLSQIYKSVRHSQPYMTKQRFARDWATADLLKQFMSNYRRYGRRRGRIPAYKQNNTSNTNSGIDNEPRTRRHLPNIDDDDDDAEEESGVGSGLDESE